MMTRGLPSAATISTALPDVQHTSTSAFTAAVVFTYATAGTPGYFDRSSRTSAAVTDSAREQPAPAAGSNTFRSGLRSFAVSAMNRTPHTTIVAASVLAA